MTFLNMALLAGAAALAVPLIIHLFSRRRYTPIPWGAMFLIEQVVRQNRRRVRLEQWILLLIRCAVPVVLALLMARPVLTGWRTLIGDEPASAVIILDGSYSMAAPAAAGGTGSDAANAALQTVLRELPKNSNATVLLAGSGTRTIDVPAVPAGDEMGAASTTAATRPAELGPADAPAAVAAARDLLKDAKHRRREIILISDFQKLNWNGPTTAETLDPDEEPPELTFIRIDTADAPNLVAEELTLSPPTVGAGRPVRVRALVRNMSDHDQRNVPVRLFVDGVPRDETRLNLARSATAEANFITRFDTPGPHTIEVRIEGDSLAADNSLRRAVHVPESVPVLLVGPEAGLPFPQNPTDFLALALDPAAASQQLELASLLRPEVIDADDLTGRALAETRIVILANVPSLSEPQVALLRDFVRNGGGLIVFPGDRTDIGFHNETDLFPARLVSLRGESGDTRIVEPPYAHPALLPWNDPGNGRLGEATLRRWYSLRPRSSAATVVTFESGEPFLVEQALGRGVVLMAASSAGADWSDLPLRAAFLPLVQQLAGYAASQGTPPLTVWAGQPLVLPLAPDQASELVMIAASGERHLVSATLDRDRTLARFTETSSPGFYQLVQSGKEDVPLATFAVNAPREESELARLSEEELRELATSLEASAVSGGEGYMTHDQDRRYGREAWRWMWVAVLALLFGELLLQGWFASRGMGRARHGGEA